MGRSMSPEDRIELKLRLRRLRLATKPKLSLRAVGMACGGKSPQGVAAWEDPKKANLPKLSDAAALADLYGVDLRNLVKNVEDLPAEDDNIESINPTAGRAVPSVEWDDIARFQGGENVSQVKTITQHPCGPRSFQTYVKNDENHPDLKEGDGIIVDPDARPNPGDFCLAWDGDRLGIGRYQPRGGKVEVEPQNGRWEKFLVERGDVVGIITEYSRGRASLRR